MDWDDQYIFSKVGLDLERTRRKRALKGYEDFFFVYRGDT